MIGGTVTLIKLSKVRFIKLSKVRFSKLTKLGGQASN